jgi:hypothetical protein
MVEEVLVLQMLLIQLLVPVQVEDDLHFNEP